MPKVYQNKPISVMFMNGYKVTGTVDVMDDYDDEEMSWSTDVSFLTNNMPNFGKVYVKHSNLKVEKITDTEAKWIVDRYNDVSENGNVTSIAAHPSYQDKYFIMLGKSVITKDFGTLNNLLYACTGLIKQFNTFSPELAKKLNQVFLGEDRWKLAKTPYTGHNMKGNNK